MHKKLLALVATVAILLSAFPANVFAVTQSTLALILNTTKLISSAPYTEYQLISGTIPIVHAKAAAYKIRVEGQQAGIIYDQLTTNGNSFYFYLPTNLAPQDITVTALAAGNVVAAATIEVRYNVTTNPSQLQFSYSGEQSPVAITGKVTNSKGQPVAGTTVTLVGLDIGGNASGNSYFPGIKTNAKGEFGAAVLEWLAAELLELRLGSEADAVAHAQGEVAPKEASLQVTPNKAVRTVTQTSFEVTSSGFAAEVERVAFTLLKDSQPLADHETLPLPQSVQTDGTGSFTTAFNWTPQQAGTYTLIASTGNHVAATTIVVTNPTSYNLINSAKLDQLKVGVNEFTIGPSDIHLVHFLSSSNFVNDFIYTVYIDDQLTQDTISGQGFTKLATGRIAIPTTGLGTKAITIVAHKLADKYNPDAKPAFERTITAKTDGWDATLSLAQLTVNQEQNLTLVIRDENGAAVNNARIDIEGYAPYLPGTANVQSGTYRFQGIKLTTVGPKTIRAYQGDRLMAEIELEVVGQPVYQVTTATTTLLQGQAEAVQLTVIHNGTAVTPWLVRLLYADGASDTVYQSYLSPGVSTVKINATKAGPLTLRVENTDGTLCGEAKLQVVAPKLALLDQEVTKLTNNFKTQVRFQVVDPRNNSVLTENLTVVPNHLSVVETYDTSGGLGGTTILGAAQHTLTIFPKALAADWDAAAAQSEAVTVGFKIGNTLVDGAFAVEAATLTSNPDKIFIGAKNNLTLTYLDANNRPIVGQEVVADDASLGKTDNNGRVIYPVSVVTSTAVTVKAATEVDAAKVSLAIKLAYDTVAPQLTYKVIENRATFTITDDLRLVRIEIDGRAIDFWPGPTYQFERTLQPGVNRIHVKAQDSNDNVLDEVITVSYTPEPEAIVLRGSQVLRHGDFIFVQARQFEDLGARFTWKAAAKAATFALGNNKVEVIIGSLIARVNGTPVAMPAAPILINERTYIPLRFVSETLGWKTHWSAGDIITILP